jgi:hypothetical protein
VHLEGYFTFDQQMAYDWCSAVCHYNEDLRPHRNLLFACLRIGYRRFNTIPTQTTILSPHHLRMVPLVFSSKDEGVIGDFLCAWCTNPVPVGFGDLTPHTGRLVDLVNLESFGSRLQYLAFRALGRMKHTDFEQVGLSKLIALLDRIEDEAMFRAPDCETFCWTHWPPLKEERFSRCGIGKPLRSWLRGIDISIVPTCLEWTSSAPSRRRVNGRNSLGGWELFGLRLCLLVWLKTRWRTLWGPRSWLFGIIPMLRL